MRIDQRAANQLRPVRIHTNYIPSADGSVLIEWGNTRVICTAMLEAGVPGFAKELGEGWLTAEYGMLPASTNTRKRREGAKPDGRSVEIKRLIGRSLRAVVDRKALGLNTVWIDCDVIQADGGTRTASITGAYVALKLAAQKWLQQGIIERDPVTSALAAVSAGVVGGECMLDLCYAEDSAADVDMNVIMTGEGRFVEVQGTGEHATFSMEELQHILALAQGGIRELMRLQQEAIDG